MTPEMQHALVQEHLDTAWLYRAFASIKNGLGVLPNRNVVGQPKSKETEPQPTPLPPVASTSGLQTSATVLPPVTAGILKPIVAAAVLGAGTLGAGLGIGSWFSSNSETTTTATTITEQLPGDGDLLFELQKRGYHLPPAGGAK